jgi:hypothetical protein
MNSPKLLIDTSLLLSVHAPWAQRTTATLHGSVNDASGAGRREDLAEKGRRHTKRTMPW